MHLLPQVVRKGMAHVLHGLVLVLLPSMGMQEADQVEDTLQASKQSMERPKRDLLEAREAAHIMCSSSLHCCAALENKQLICTGHWPGFCMQLWASAQAMDV
jgi:hypothetical protein